MAVNTNQISAGFSHLEDRDPFKKVGVEPDEIVTQCLAALGMCVMLYDEEPRNLPVYHFQKPRPGGIRAGVGITSQKAASYKADIPVEKLHQATRAMGLAFSR